MKELSEMRDDNFVGRATCLHMLNHLIKRLGKYVIDGRMFKFLILKKAVYVSCFMQTI
jgi:hypothetical protein